jgi:nucleoside phosphorylase
MPCDRSPEPQPPRQGTAPETLVCFALEAEAGPFRRLARALTGVGILVTGMGQANARRAATDALARARPDIVLTCGLAGALDPGLAHGTILFDADPGFPGRERLLQAGAQPARFHCAARIAATASEKAQLRQTTQADAVEMESEPIRAICRAAGIPSATFRVISDVAAEDLPLDFNRFLTSSLELDYARLLGAVALHPGAVPGLLRLQRQTRSATARLADALACIFHTPEVTWAG